MSAINISHLSFSYNNGDELVFDDLDLILDSDWKLGLIGRNGCGKTTLLRILNGELEYSGDIAAKVEFRYFPFRVDDEGLSMKAIADKILGGEETWKFERETYLLGLTEEVLSRAFESLSNGEQTKSLLALLFAQENCFFLIDEPTNHLDAETREVIARYLQKKQGFILVSHDRTLLNQCVDHILAINRTSIDLQKGNFAVWWREKDNKDSMERAKNAQLQKEIRQLEAATKRTKVWADKVEKTKIGAYNKGWVGHQSARMMKRAKSTEMRRDKMVEEKRGLLKDIEEAVPLKMNASPNRSGNMVEVTGLTISYGGRQIIDDLSFTVKEGERLRIQGTNGSGKSSILKAMLGKIQCGGMIKLRSGIKVSYIPQSTADLRGDLNEFIKEKEIDGTLMRAILRKLGFRRELFDEKLEDYSEGQKKKVLLAKSLCEPANLYIWDEPLNYIDVISRTQLEEVILQTNPTMVFIEHDSEFAEKIATKTLIL